MLKRGTHLRDRDRTVLRTAPPPSDENLKKKKQTKTELNSCAWLMSPLMLSQEASQITLQIILSSPDGSQGVGAPAEPSWALPEPVYIHVWMNLCVGTESIKSSSLSR